MGATVPSGYQWERSLKEMENALKKGGTYIRTLNNPDRELIS